MLSLCFWNFSVSVGAFVMGPSQISSFFPINIIKFRIKLLVQIYMCHIHVNESRYIFF